MIEESKLVKLLEIQIKDKLEEETINVNGKEYISMDIFINLMREAMMTDILLGALLHKEGSKKISDEEVLMYISERYADTSISYNDGKYSLFSKSVE